MDNICIQKIWEDKDFFEIRIEASNEYVNVNQTCYIMPQGIREIAEKMKLCAQRLEGDKYYEFGCKTGKATPSFSIEVADIDDYGHVLLELELEINDNENRAHWCKLYVKTELGCFERFAEALAELPDLPIGEEIWLHL